MPCVFLLLMLASFNTMLFAQEQDSREKIVAVKTFRGILVSFYEGDYVYAIVRKSNGKKKTFGIGEIGIECFMAMHHRESLLLTYEIVDAAQTGGGKERIERLTKAKSRSDDLDRWLKRMTARQSYEEFEKKCDPVIKRFTLP